MAKPITLLEGLSAHVLSFGSSAFETERDVTGHRAFALIDGVRKRVANFSSSDAKEFSADLREALRKPLRTVIVGAVYEIRFRALDEDRCLVNVAPAPRLDPNVKPTFAAKQGEYLSFIYRYSKRYNCAPAQTDLERHFMVSVHP